MRVFVAGAAGAIGTRLVPKLIERGHDVALLPPHHSFGFPLSEALSPTKSLRTAFMQRWTAPSRRWHLGCPITEL